MPYPASWAAIRPLVVEDEAPVALMLQGILRDIGFGEPVTVHSIAEAAGHLARHPVDFAIVDLHLGGRMALPLAADFLRRGVRFMFCTGARKDAIPDEFLAVPVLRKPFTPEDLIAAIHATLGPTDRS
ncbi:response regulator receiver domain-containing protein [Stella humosa]|uniref:Response regulator receiver domain-containing protein n=1 Tax=Stella humosa TaxID=94 RepID=A0A3N1MCS3_9PROT|nr:response regulator [Stella humosa]ROQ01089.1 response regulator receiver domain-containing protein [Stella humosa]BBK31461.1 hypothetical protein STHU_20950 [Stella humosa]